MKPEPISVVAAVNDRRVLDRNLLASPELRDTGPWQFLAQQGFRSASLAYLDALDRATHDLVLFVHQDVYLPADWFAAVRRSIRRLEDRGVKWGVLGAFGSRADAAGGLGTVYTTGLGLHGNPLREPAAVETLDEIVLIVRKSSGVRFDPGLPHFHLYGADLCLTGQSRGLPSFALPACCVHNTQQLLRLPAEFHACYRYLKRKWTHRLPIETACVTVSRFDVELRRRELRHALARLLGRVPTARRRADDPTTLLTAAGRGGSE